MRALVTGGAGFIGSHLVDLLQQEGHEVFVLDNLITGNLNNLPKGITVYHKDIRNPLDDCLKEIDWVFHLAGLTDLVASIDHPANYYHTNVTGTLNVLEAARKMNVKRFIYAASASCYGTPLQFPTSEEASLQLQFPYALTKRMGEELVLHYSKVYNLPALSLRLFNVFGPRIALTGSYGSVFSIFLKQKKQGQPLTVVGDGLQTRDFIYVEDVAHAFYLAAKSELTGEVMNVGSGREQKIVDLAKMFEEKIVHISKREGETERSIADISKIKTLLSWEPKMPFEKGVKKLLDHHLFSAATHQI